MTLPKLGARVRVWPLHDRVQSSDQPAGPGFAGSFMEPDGHDVIWSSFHAELLRGGAIAFHNPTPVPVVSSKTAPAPTKTAE